LGDNRNRAILPSRAGFVGTRLIAGKPGRGCSPKAAIAPDLFVGLLDAVYLLTGGGQLRLAGTSTHQLVRMVTAEQPAIAALDLRRLGIQIHAQYGSSPLQPTAGGHRRRGPRLMALAQPLLLGLTQPGEAGPASQQMERRRTRLTV